MNIVDSMKYNWYWYKRLYVSYLTISTAPRLDRAMMFAQETNPQSVVWDVEKLEGGDLSSIADRDQWVSDPQAYCFQAGLTEG